MAKMLLCFAACESVPWPGVAAPARTNCSFANGVHAWSSVELMLPVLKL